MTCRLSSYFQANFSAFMTCRSRSDFQANMPVVKTCRSRSHFKAKIIAVVTCRTSTHFQANIIGVMTHSALRTARYYSVLAPHFVFPSQNASFFIYCSYTAQYYSVLAPHYAFSLKMAHSAYISHSLLCTTLYWLHTIFFLKMGIF